MGGRAYTARARFVRKFQRPNEGLVDGQVLGVVFGASADESDIGYALTADEVRRLSAILRRWIPGGYAGVCSPLVERVPVVVASEDVCA